MKKLKTLNLKDNYLMFQNTSLELGRNIRNTPLFKHIIENKWLYKSLLILVLLAIITIVVCNYTIYIASLKYNKFKEEKKERINKFTEEFINGINEEGFETTEMKNSWENVWQTKTPSFTFNNNIKKSFGYLYENEKIEEGFTEGLWNPFEASSWSGAGDTMNNSILGPIKDLLREPIEKIQFIFDGINKAIDWITHFKENVLDPITGGFQGIYDYIISLKDRFEKLGNGIADLFKAFGNSFVTIANAVYTIGDDIGGLIYGGGKCLVHFGGNFRSCLIFWLLDFVSELIYSMFVLLPIYISDALVPSLDLSSRLQDVKGWINDIDDILIDIIGYSCIHYPKSIINDCYMCGEVDFQSKVRELNDDTNKINSSFDSLGQDYKTAFYEIGGFFQDEYYRKLDAIKSGDPKKMFSEFNPAPITTAFVKGAAAKNEDKKNNNSGKKNVNTNPDSSASNKNPNPGFYEDKPQFVIVPGKNTLTTSLATYGTNYAIYSAVKASKK